VPKDIGTRLVNWIRNDLTRQQNLSLATQEKPVVYSQDLERFTEHLFSYKAARIFSSGIDLARLLTVVRLHSLPTEHMS
jgi:hypothetical protein